MPSIIDYPAVLEHLRRQRYECLYFNSGAFGFPMEADVHITGWLGPDDPTLKPLARDMGLQIAEPHEENLARLAMRAWHEHLPGPAWVMPMSHWSYELDFGSRDWMPAALKEIDVDPTTLIGRNNAAAIQFSEDESAKLEQFAATLLRSLVSSDFAIAFPSQPALCTIHHHKQLWWQTSDMKINEHLREMALGA